MGGRNYEIHHHICELKFLAVVINSSVSAHETHYSALLSGTSETPPNNSPALGTVLVTLDTDLITMNVDTSFSGLIGNVTAAHIHCCTAVAGTGSAVVATQVPSFTGFPEGVAAGSYNHSFDMSLASSYNQTGTTGFLAIHGGSVSQAFNALVAGLDTGKAYLNIHTSDFPAGEIREFLQPVPTAVPIPAAFWLMGSTIAGLMSFSRWRG